MTSIDVSDEELLARLREICVEGHIRTARLIEYLIEVEDRRLDLREACSSLFDFCLRRLGMSEGSAFRRMTAARLVRRFPSLLPRLERGELHLSGLVLLRDHLTAANVDELAAAASGRSKREVEKLLAARAPRPDAPTVIRKLPRARDVAATPPAKPAQPLSSLQSDPAPSGVASAVAASAPEASVASSDASDREASEVSVASSDTGASPTPPPRVRARTRIEPLSEDRYKLQVTLSGAVCEKLERAQAMMRHRNASGDMEVVLESALDALLEKLEKQRLAKTTRPQGALGEAKKGYVRRSSRRDTFERDGEQCTFVDKKGCRCPAVGFLELDHGDPRALGGSDEAPNLHVMCAAHNRLRAEEVFGRDYVARRIHFRQRKSRGQRPIRPLSERGPPREVRDLATRDLVGMGFGEKEARRAVSVVFMQHADDEPALPIEVLLREAIRVLA